MPVLGWRDDRRRLFLAIETAVREIARTQPLLLVLEDAQWCDDLTLDLVRHLARRVAAEPVVIAVTYRTDALTPRLEQLVAELAPRGTVAPCLLAPLTSPDVEAMLRAMFGRDALLDTTLVAELHTLTAGNPHAIEEVLRALVHAGDILTVDGTWILRALDPLTVPRSAAEAAGRRVAGLSDVARRVVSVAAVADRRLDFALLQAVTGHDDETLRTIVTELADAALVVEEAGGRVAFRHASTREHLGAQLPPRERVALHRLIARALEQHLADADGEADAALAQHAFACSDWALASRIGRRVAVQAWALRAARETLLHLERVFVAEVRAGNTPEPALLASRARAHEALGDDDQAHRDFAASVDAARESGDRHALWEALHALGQLWARRDYERAGQYRREALALARAINEPALVARSLNRIGTWYVNREDPESGARHHQEALTLFERLGDAPRIAQTVASLAMARHIAGHLVAAAELFDRNASQFAQLGDRRGQATALAMLAMCGPSHHASSGEVSTNHRVQETLVEERAVTLAAAVGWRSGEAAARYLLADCLAWRGDYRRALHLAHEALGVARDLEHLEWQCGALRVLGVISLELCALDDAIAYLRAAHDIARTLGSATWTRWTGAPLAIALVRTGALVEAVAVLDIVDHSVRRPHGNTAFAGDTLGTRDLALARAEHALAKGEFAAVLQLLSVELFGRVPRALLLRAQASLALDDVPAARAALDAAHDEALRQEASPLLWRIEAMRGAVAVHERQRQAARDAFDGARTIAARLADALESTELTEALLAGLDRLAPPPVSLAELAALAASRTEDGAGGTATLVMPPAVQKSRASARKARGGSASRKKRR